MASAVVVRDGAAIVFCSCGLPVPREVIAVAVCRYLRYGVSDRDVEELFAERGVVVDYVTVYWWVQTFTAEFIDADRPSSFHPLDGRDQQRQPVTFERRTSRCFHSHGGHGCRRADPASRLGYRQGRSAFIWASMRAAVTAVSSSLNVASRAAALTAGVSSRASECCATSAASRTGANGAACRRRSTRHRLAGPPTSACRGSSGTRQASAIVGRPTSFAFRQPPP